MNKISAIFFNSQHASIAIRFATVTELVKQDMLTHAKRDPIQFLLLINRTEHPLQYVYFIYAHLIIEKMDRKYPFDPGIEVIK